MADPDILFGGGARGTEVGRRRRDDRGAEGAEGGVPLPTGGGVWGVPLPRKFFSIFLSKNGVFWSILMSKCASHVYT